MRRGGNGREWERERRGREGKREEGREDKVKEGATDRIVNV